MSASHRRKYRYDPERFWVVVEIWDDDSSHRPVEPVQLHFFEDREPAREFLELPIPVNQTMHRMGPYSVLRTPSERATSLLAAAADAVLSVPIGMDVEEREFLKTALQMAQFDETLDDIYRDVRRTVLYENKTNPSDPRYAVEQALKPYLELKNSIRKKKASE